MVKGLNSHLSAVLPVSALANFEQCAFDECDTIAASVIAGIRTLQ